MPTQSKQGSNDSWGCIAIVIGLMVVGYLGSHSGGSNPLPWLAGGGGVEDGAAEFAEQAGEPDYLATKEALGPDIYDITEEAPIYDPPVPQAPTTDEFYWWDGHSDVDCHNFKTHAQAQRFYQLYGHPETDPFLLDSDRDGLACEALP